MNPRSALRAAGHSFREKNISNRAKRIVISPIKEMSMLADLVAQEGGAEIISFGQGIPYVDTPAHIKEAVRKSLDEWDTARYTLEPGIPELRSLIAEHLTISRKLDAVDGSKDVMVTVGCQEAVACALATTMDEGDEALIFSPDFASYTEQIVQFGGVAKVVPLSEESGWTLDKDALTSAVGSKTKLILFSNPVNPTGVVFSKEDIEAICAVAKKNDLIVISDETYDFLTYEGIEHISPASIPDMKDRVIVCGSFSKKYSLTGYRVGYAYADAGIIDHMLKVHDALAICAPAISQKAAIAALKGPQDCVRDLKDRLARNRELMYSKLDELSDFFSYVKPKGAYYILAKYLFTAENSFDLAIRILKEAHVIVIPGGAFGFQGEGHIRFSFAGAPEKIEEGFARLKEWLKREAPSV